MRQNLIKIFPTEPTTRRIYLANQFQCVFNEIYGPPERTAHGGGTSADEQIAPRRNSKFQIGGPTLNQSNGKSQGTHTNVHRRGELSNRGEVASAAAMA